MLSIFHVVWEVFCMLLATIPQQHRSKVSLEKVRTIFAHAEAISLAYTLRDRKARPMDQRLAIVLAATLVFLFDVIADLVGESTASSSCEQLARRMLQELECDLDDMQVVNPIPFAVALKSRSSCRVAEWLAGRPVA